MTRTHLRFPCGDDNLAGTLDEASGSSGLLIVSGGNEIRSGAFSGQSQLAAAIAQAGYPVFRYDRRGIGDSEGENRGFRESAEDILAAAAAFRANAPQMQRLVAFGNCDAASALMLSEGNMIDFLLLSNPWTIEEDDGAMAPDAVRSRYAEKLKNPKELLRLVTGQVNLGKLMRGIKQALGPKAEPTTLAQDMAEGLAQASKPFRILLAENDRTAQIFDAQWPGNANGEIRRCKGASHAYVEPHARQWLFDQILDVLRG
ncbi:hydrolase 1, exosortase A system-associated [Altererythrobacter sp.]|uniref:hydrolase 1, exosortase A system-associated n=1 Tax=Altererythrobacter sp. TaxID=1872480 RepID=UPI003D0F6D25